MSRSNSISRDNYVKDEPNRGVEGKRRLSRVCDMVLDRTQAATQCKQATLVEEEVAGEVRNSADQGKAHPHQVEPMSTDLVLEPVDKKEPSDSSVHLLEQ
eukprot:SAG11_NODE_1846_length_4172_cov_3.188313_5_plen_100_part_00